MISRLFNYDFKTHFGLFLVYNIPYMIAIFTTMLGLALGVDIVDDWAEMLFINYWYDGHLFDDVVAWRIHVILNILIFLFVLFGSDNDDDEYYW